jgi:hypothetical protein
MRISQSIQRIGFHKWYERELLRSHANLVLLVMSTLALLGCAEAYRRTAPILDQLQLLAGAAASAAIGVMALRRYLYRLRHAEFVANQAVCGKCETYARFETLDTPGDGSRLRARCRKCAHEWDIEV